MKRLHFGGAVFLWRLSLAAARRSLQERFMETSELSSRALVTVTGLDHSGIVASLTARITEVGAHLLDVEQVVLQGRLTLCVLVALPSDLPGSPDGELLDALRQVGTEVGCTTSVQMLESGDSRLPVANKRYAVTVIGENLDAEGFAAVTSVIAKAEASIVHIRRLSGGPFRAVELWCALRDDVHADAMRLALMQRMAGSGLELAVQEEGINRRHKRLVVMDMDSTLVQIEVIDELAPLHGVVDKVSAITHRAMEGELDFEASLRERVALLKGLPMSRAMELARNLPITEGARTLVQVLQRIGARTAVISGGFMFAANTLKAELGLNYAYANKLVVRDGLITGELDGPIVTPQRKADLLDAIAQRERIDLAQVVAIGDGANDMRMLQKAGFGVAYHAKAKLREASDACLSTGGLDRVLYMFGFGEDEIARIVGA